VERTVSHVKKSFWAGITYTDVDDLKRQAHAWCERINSRVHRTTHARPVDRPALADRALSAGYAVVFTTLAELAQTLESASHPGLMRQRQRRYIAPSLLVIDEVGYTRLSQEQAHHSFELVAL